MSFVITDAASLGKAVRSARKDRSLSQRALAERCGVSQRFISELERGKPTAELGKALQVLSVLGIALVAQPEGFSAFGRDAVERLATDVSARLERKLRPRTALADYLEV